MREQRVTLPATIRNGLKYLCAQDEQTFLRKLREQSDDPRLSAHTRIELIPGVFAAIIGLVPQYEPKLEGQRPDWLFLDKEAKPYFFGDVINFHMNDSIEKRIDEAMEAGHPWGGELPDSRTRLYSSLQKKVVKYKELADAVALPFVPFLYGWFDAFLHPKEVESCLRNLEWGLFGEYPQLTGVYHFDDAIPVGRGCVNPGYHFHFYRNPEVSGLTLEDGLVPVPIPKPPTR
jgi:hypothetical protein